MQVVFWKNKFYCTKSIIYLVKLFQSLKVVHISLVVVIFIYVIGLRYWHILLSKRTSPMDHSPKYDS